MSRRLKQLLYGGAYLAILVGVVVWVSGRYLKTDPSCVDGVQNQNEEGIDCGGICSPFCFPPDLKEITLTGTPSIFPLSEGDGSLLAQIKNSNTDLAIKNFEYFLDLKDESGEVIRTLSGESFIHAQEVKYLFLPSVEVSPERIKRVAFRFRNPAWVRARDFQKPKFTVQNYETLKVANHYEVSGVIANQDARALRAVQVVAVFFGQFGQAAGASVTELDGIPFSETASFTVTYPLIPGIEPSATQVFVFARR